MKFVWKDTSTPIRGGEFRSYDLYTGEDDAPDSALEFRAILRKRNATTPWIVMFWQRVGTNSNGMPVNGWVEQEVTFDTFEEAQRYCETLARMGVLL